MAADSSLCVDSTTSSSIAIDMPQHAATESNMASVLTPTNENNKRALQPDTEEESADQSQNKKRPLTFVASWQKKTYTLTCTPEETVQQLKTKLQELTNADDTRLDSLSLRRKPGSDAIEFLMLGTADEKIFKDPDQVDTLPDVFNDLEYDYFPSDHPTHLDQAKVQRKLKDTIAKIWAFFWTYSNEIHRLDYTLFDCKSPASHISELMRPGMHSFLTSAYEHYDIVIWSQTSWRTLEAKVTELGILSHPDYKIAFVMDITTMISVTTLKADGSEFKHQVKPLEIIWAKFPQFSSKNTIHVDDLSRNFALNPKAGLKISAFKHAPVKRLTDRELYYVARYLLLIIDVDDFTTLNHKRWRSYHGVSE
ncbi:hypothetical protein NQZ79_g1394 [Umbelopsis isabellina]|nr:hypothetical protein NQZ79_g1394 [Umbelopsis isabellina]